MLNLDYHNFKTVTEDPFEIRVAKKIDGSLDKLIFNAREIISIEKLRSIIRSKLNKTITLSPRSIYHFFGIEYHVYTITSQLTVY